MVHLCGIIGYIGKKEAAPILVKGLKRLEYRGYDSAGIAVLHNNKIDLKKGAGDIDFLSKKLDFLNMQGYCGIGHTRWATHGEVNDKNAHPFLSKSKKFALVHNGIIENSEELKKSLDDSNYVSDTDSEVVLHIFENKLKNGLSIKKAFVELFRELHGTFAILILNAESGEIYALKRDSPLSLGIGKNEYFIGSDIFAFSEYTNKAIFFDDDEFAIINQNKFSFYDKNGFEINKKATEFEWVSEEKINRNFEHYMLKEIYDSPNQSKKLLVSLDSEQKEKFEKLVKLVLKADKIVFVAAGSSYHASLYGSCLLNKMGFDTRAVIASEFKNYAHINKNSLIFAVSQSGETMDVIEAIKPLKNSCLSLVSLVNVPYSSIQRNCLMNFNMLAGQEICVASTKTYINEILFFLRLAKKFNPEISLENISNEIKKVITENLTEIKKLSETLKNKEHIYIIGKGLGYAVAREIALKLKEISYIHAEGLMGGELKHGTLALIEKGTPVITLIPEKNDSVLSNLKEVESRKAMSIKISPYYGNFKIPEGKEKFGVYATIIGFLLTYYIAKLKNLPIDKPRNLAKSVTVK